MFRTTLASVLVASLAMASLSSCAKDPIQEELIQYGEGVTITPFNAQDAPTLRDGQFYDADIDPAPPIHDPKIDLYQNGPGGATGKPDGWTDPNTPKEEVEEPSTI